jgi:hypothetical protein
MGVIVELLIAVASMFLDGSDYGKPSQFDLEAYLNDRDARNAEAAYGDEMWRMGWRG